MSPPWRFRSGEPIPEAFRRVATESLAAVRAELASPEGDREKAVHEARRSFKRLRALLRLASPALEAPYANENRRLRDAGRLLAPARDAAVLIQSFDRFAAEHGEGLDGDELARLRAGLASRRAAGGVAGEALEANIGRALKLLERTERNLLRLAWPAEAADLEKGLRRSHARVKASFRAARESAEPEDLHEWRKRLKDEIAQTELLRDQFPEVLAASRKSAREIAQLLGLEHDLCLLSARLEAVRVPGKARGTRKELVDRIEARRRKLRQKAFRLGEAHAQWRMERLAGKAERGATEAGPAASAAGGDGAPPLRASRGRSSTSRPRKDPGAGRNGPPRTSPGAA